MFLKNFGLSEGITKHTMVRLTQYLKEKMFGRRDIVYNEGDIADKMYFIRDGEFEVKIILELIVIDYRYQNI